MSTHSNNTRHASDEVGRRNQSNERIIVRTICVHSEALRSANSVIMHKLEESVLIQVKEADFYASPYINNLERNIFSIL